MGVSALRPAEHLDTHQPASTAIVCCVKHRLHLYHFLTPTADVLRLRTISPVGQCPAPAKPSSGTLVGTAQATQRPRLCTRPSHRAHVSESTDECISCTEDVLRAARPVRSRSCSFCYLPPVQSTDAWWLSGHWNPCSEFSLVLCLASLSQYCHQPGEVATQCPYLAGARQLSYSLLHSQIEGLAPNLHQLAAELIVTSCSQLSCIHQIAARLANVVCTGNFAAARRNASRAKLSSTPCISYSIRPG